MATVVRPHKAPAARPIRSPVAPPPPKPVVVLQPTPVMRKPPLASRPDEQTRQRNAEALFGALLVTGFRNIHGVIHHQTEGFDQGMPTDLAFRLAGRNAVMKRLEAERGLGWWGDRAMQDYYAAQAQGAGDRAERSAVLLRALLVALVAVFSVTAIDTVFSA